MDDELTRTLKETNSLLRAQIKGQAAWRGFLNGVLAGLGGTVGLAIVITLLFYALKKAQVLPGIGQRAAEIESLLEQSRLRQ